MDKLRIVFMGTPDFAVGILDAIRETEHKIVGVVTAPDKPAGRGQKLSESAVKKYAVKHNLKVLQPTNLKSPEFLEKLKALEADVQVVVAFRMLPKEVWQMPEKGTFNLHASLLPEYRGAAPINWAIINGETETGVTTFFIDEQIDTGAMILHKKEAIHENDNVGTLHDRLMNLGKTAVVETLEQIAHGSVSVQKQEIVPQKTAYKLFKENTQIDWSKSGKEIYNHIRGLSPYPTAWSNMQHEGKEFQVKIYEAKFEGTTPKHQQLDLVYDKQSLKVCVKDGYISILQLQMPGKKATDIKSFLNGFKIEANTKFF